ncbi:MAG: T9SS type A sorting domain-containing protein [bacterium]|nr:T9SS type A sorting domain-containing protein [bacterium]
MKHTRVPVSVLLVLLVGALAGTAFGQVDKLAPIEGVNFAVGDVDGVFIPNTTSDPTSEEGIVSLSLRGIVGSAPDSAKTIVFKIAYPVDQLAFLGGSLDAFGSIAAGDVVWPGDEIYSETAGVVTVFLDAGAVATPTDFVEFYYLKFAPLCQESGAPATMTVLTGLAESYVSYQDLHYTDPSSPAPTGTFSVAEYAGYVSVLDDDPFDGEPAGISLPGAVDADLVIDVPIYLSSNANVLRVQGFVPYDETRLVPIGVVAGNDCTPWYWTYGGPPDPMNGTIYIDLFNYPFSDNDTSTPCLLATVSFRVVGDWRGETEPVEFQPWGVGIHVGNSTEDVCAPLAAAYTYHSGPVTMEDYAATLAMVVEDMVYADDAGTAKIFSGVIEATHNYTIGGDTVVDDPTAAAIRIDLDLGPDMVLLNMHQPDPGAPDPANPLDDFWFEYQISSAKSPLQKIELYSSYEMGVVGERSHTADSTPLVGLDFIQQNIAAPATFETDGFPLTLACDFEGRFARVRDAVTDSLETNCADNLTLVQAPRLAYANAELTCDQRTSTRPSSVVQDYYLRSTFPVADFLVTVVEDGPHHIIDVDPAAGVEIVDQGLHHVTFGPTTGWQPDVFATRYTLGSITYNTSAAAVAHDVLKSVAADKDINPPIRWCWRWTTIAFGGDSFVHDATGQDPFLFTATGSVGTRYDCSPIIDPDTPAVLNKALPAAFALVGNHPNPFNPETVISFELPEASAVKIVIHDVQGRRVTTLVDGVREAGRYEAVWTGRDQTGRRVASGTYFYVMRAGDFTEYKKMILLK